MTSVKLLLSFSACFLLICPIVPTHVLFKPPIKLSAFDLLCHRISSIPGSSHATFKIVVSKEQSVQINLSNMFLSCSDYVFPVF